MKKILAFLMAVTTCFCTFTACGKNDDSEEEKSDKSTSSERDDDDEDDDDDNKSISSIKDKLLKNDRDEEDNDNKDSDKEDEEDKDNNKDDEDDEVEATTEAKEEDSDKDDEVVEDETKEAEKEEEKDKNDGGSVSAADEMYLDLFKDLCQAAIDKDTDAIMRAAFPSALIEAFVKAEAYDFLLESVNGSYGSMEGVNLDSITLSSVSDCDTATIENLELLYSAYSNLFFAMAENGISYKDMEAGNISQDKMLVLLEPAMQLSQITDIESLKTSSVERSVTFEEAKFVSLTADGDPQTLVMYKTVGDDWKIDLIGLALIGY